MKRHSHQQQPKVADRLRAESHKLTGPRRAIICALEQQSHPATIRDIRAALGSACDPATIYRSMHLLEKMHLVKRFDFGDATARYELVRHEDHEHHHHLICTDCSKVVEIEECFPEELEHRIASGNGFAQITHKLEFFGVCPACQTK